MTYTTRDELIDRYGEQALIQLTDRAGTGAIDDAVLSRAIDGASARIDATLKPRYALPLADVPRVLADIAQALTYHALHVEGAPEKVVDDQRQALRDLDAITAGRLDLPPGTGPAPTEQGLGEALLTNEPTRNFGRADTAGW